MAAVAAGACCGRLQRLLLQGIASNELHCNSWLCPAGAIAVSDVQPGQLQWSGARHGACAAASCAARHAMRTPWQHAVDHSLLTLPPADFGCLHDITCASPLLLLSCLAVRWDDVLAFELRVSREGHYPDRLVVHRQGTPGWQVGRSWALMG